MNQEVSSQIDALSTKLLELSSTEIQEWISSVPPSCYSLILRLLEKEPPSTAQTKLQAILEGLKEPSNLEELAKHLSLAQFTSILKGIYEKKITLQKLSPVLVGLSPSIFAASLPTLSKNNLEILKRESILEPLQHQVQLFVRECEHTLQGYLEEADKLYQEINNLNRESLTHQDVDQIQLRAENLRGYYEDLISTIDAAQAIAWNTNRIDLIEKLSTLKEYTHYQLQHVIGASRSEQIYATGLFKALEQILYSLYTPLNKTQNNIESLDDEDPAIEGLTKLSIWYLQDYWELGLLPNIKSKDELELDSKKHAELDRLKYRQHLFNLVQQNLNKMGLKKIKDLKKHKVFSKKMLMEYIAKHLSTHK